MFRSITRRSVFVAGVFCAALQVTAAGAADAQKAFPGAGAAMDALVSAFAAGDAAALAAILGPGSEDIISSGDPVADKTAREQFVAAVQARTVIEYDGDDHVNFSVGDDEWPVPIPLVKEAGGWRFDTAAGREEILNRRIGRNELHAIAVVRGMVDAQEEYADADPTKSGVRQYAQRIISSQGQRDGLYWPVKAGDEESPLGELVAAAVKEGYGGADTGKPVPYHGYYFRLLKEQGKGAPGGAKSYLKDGKLTGGFGVVAWPADYGNSGVKTFIVNQRDLVFEKDLGADTEKLAAAIIAYDPDVSWEPVEEPSE
jgi:hypothetical protein